MTTHTSTHVQNISDGNTHKHTHAHARMHARTHTHTHAHTHCCICLSIGVSGALAMNQIFYTDGFVSLLALACEGWSLGVRQVHVDQKRKAWVEWGGEHSRLEGGQAVPRRWGGDGVSAGTAPLFVACKHTKKKNPSRFFPVWQRRRAAFLLFLSLDL